jgi:hypothetical protein
MSQRLFARQQGKDVEREGKSWVCGRRYNHPRSRKGGNKKALLCGVEQLLEAIDG